MRAELGEDSQFMPPNHAAVKVFSLGVTAAAADFWFNLANIILVVGAILVALGTYGSIRMGSVREHFADLRISANEAETAKAKAAAASANEATERIRQENLKLQERLRPRTLAGSMREKLSEAMKPLCDGRPATVIWVGGAEVEDYARQIAQALDKAGFRTKVGTNFVITSAHGVIIAHKTGSPDEYVPKVIAAFAHAGVQATAGELDDLGTRPMLYVVVGYKPGEPSP